MSRARQIKTSVNREFMTCARCGIQKADGAVSFVIGAKSSSGKLANEWCMVYGTGKMACPSCYQILSDEAEQIANRRFGG